MKAPLTRRLLIASAVLPAFARTAAAHMLEQVQNKLLNSEKYFQAADKDVPDFDLQDATGKEVKFSDFRGKVVVLHFVYTNCPDTCPLHAEKIAAIQHMVNITPMKAAVQFISITTDPKRDTGKVLMDFGENHGLDPVNWTFLTAKPGQPEGITRDLAQAYGVEFKIMGNGDQMHGILTNVIDQKGRLRARFHSLRFDNLSLVLFANALVNIASEQHERPVAGIWGKIDGWFGL